MSRRLLSEFRPLPPQRAYLASQAKIRGYGGAMGGGKSRTLCEDMFNVMLDHPGIICVLARQAHTAIIASTKKTMLQVVPPELIERQKASQGEDWIELWNGSVCHFIGLDDPTRWYSTEIGCIGFDEAQEIAEEAAVRLNSRCRQQCPDCVRNPRVDELGDPLECDHYPHWSAFTFNPSSPGHWLQRWFLLGGAETDHGFYKGELYASDAIAPLGDAEFFFAKATDNKFLPKGYVEQNLGGMPERLRRRYLDGLWEFTEGNAFFDADALAFYEKVAHDSKALMTGRTDGDPFDDFDARRRSRKPDKPPKFKGDRGGPWTLWARPDPAKRYVMAIDPSSGGSYDYSAIQILCIEDFEQVAEFQGKLTPAELAVEAYRAGRVFGGVHQAALAIPEITGGLGVYVEQELKRMHYPNLYTRKVLDRLSRKWTDKTGFDTTTKTRSHILDTLERLLRERELGLHSLRSVAELATFVYGKNNKPEAQDGCNDDLVMALAIGATIMVDMPKQLRRPKSTPHQPQFQATGY